MEEEEDVQNTDEVDGVNDGNVHEEGGDGTFETANMEL